MRRRKQEQRSAYLGAFMIMKKKRTRGLKKGSTGQPQCNNNEEEKKVIENLVAAFVSVLFGEVAVTYKKAKGDANQAVEILGNLYLDEESGIEDQSTTCSTSSGNWASMLGFSVEEASSSSSSSSYSLEVFANANDGQIGVRNQKRR